MDTIRDPLRPIYARQAQYAARLAPDVMSGRSSSSARTETACPYPDTRLNLAEISVGIDFIVLVFRAAELEIGRSNAPTGVSRSPLGGLSGRDADDGEV
jgi:hypothetical protein